MRFITRRIHARLDYPVALLFVAGALLPDLGDLSPLARVVAPAIGIAAFLMTVFTDHHLHVFRILPHRLHLAVDLAVGLLFPALPLALGRTGIDAALYLATGAAVVAVIALSKPEVHRKQA